nr:STM3941 family protein [uncultured Methylophaga sp.]
MQNEDEIVIALSKFKIILIIAGSLAFVVGALWLTTLDSEQIESSRKYSNPQIAHAVGYICMAFFGLCAAYGITKLFDSKPGLIFNHKGITDNSSGVSAGLIPWAEISGLANIRFKDKKC